MPAHTTSGFDIAAQTDKGRRRRENQDSLMLASDWFQHLDIPHDLGKALRNQYGRLYIVADGVGGHADGAIASQMIVDRVMEYFYDGDDEHAPAAPNERLQYAIRRANRAVHEEAGTRQNTMASTIVAALLYESRLLVANVGDSSAWLFRAGQPPRQLTTEHAIQRGNAGRLLTQAIGAPDVRVALAGDDLRPDDVVLLCTDGLTDLVSMEEMAQIVTSCSARAATRQLIQLANARGGHDNITALVIRCGTAQRQSPSGITALLAGTASAAALLAILVILTLRSQPQTDFAGVGGITGDASFSSQPLASVVSQLQPTVQLITPTRTSTAVPLSAAIAQPAAPRPSATPTIRPWKTSTQPPSRTPTTRPAESMTTDSAGSTPTPGELASSTPTPANPATPSLTPVQRTFRGQVVVDFPSSGQSGDRQSCVQGHVSDHTHRGVAGAILEVNNGVSSTDRILTDEHGFYRFCGLGDSNWSVVLMYVPEVPLQASVVAVIYVNGSDQQIAVVDFLEQSLGAVKRG